MLKCVCLRVVMAQYACGDQRATRGNQFFFHTMYGSWGSNSGCQANCRGPYLLSHNNSIFLFKPIVGYWLYFCYFALSLSVEEHNNDF